MSFWEFCYRNQSYWEKQNNIGDNDPELISFEAFEKKVKDHYYDTVKMCLPLESILNVLAMFPGHKRLLLDFFNQKMVDLKNPELWEYKGQ